jgi:hypothetical protein
MSGTEVATKTVRQEGTLRVTVSITLCGTYCRRALVATDNDAAPYWY